jgi:serine/threonine protein kinase
VRAGQRIGKYVLDDRIAVGGMAEVWAARAEGPQGFSKPVALKFLLESFAGDPELERLFVNEARIAAQLQHANLVTVFDFDKVGATTGSDDPGLVGRYYIAMERVEGHDLRRIAEAAKRAGYVFPVGLALHLGGEVLKALRYVHERRERGRGLDLVHRDVSPHNVLVGFGGEVKLSDFGIAKTRAHTARGTKTGTVRGKLAYASPEQLNGAEVDHRTDQFALAVTLWEILAGRRLFDGHDELETIGQVVRCAIPPLDATPSGHTVPVAVEAVLRRMLAARRVDRFPSTADALSALLALRSYTADGAALGELVRTLFLPSALDVPPTMPIQAVAGAGVRSAETRTMNEPAARRTPARPTAAHAPGVSHAHQATTRPQRPTARGSQRITVAVGAGRGWSRLALAAGTLAVATLAAVAVGRRLRERDGHAPAVSPSATAPVAARPAPAPPSSPLAAGSAPAPLATGEPPAVAHRPVVQGSAPAPIGEKLLARAPRPPAPAPPPAEAPPPSTAPTPPPAEAPPPAKKPHVAANGAAILE